MRNFLHKSYTWLIMLVAMFAISGSAWAQDATYDLSLGSSNLRYTSDIDDNGVQYSYMKFSGYANTYSNGAIIWFSSQNRPIKKIVFEYVSGKGDVYASSSAAYPWEDLGTFDQQNYTWTATTNDVKYVSFRGADDIYFSKAKVWFGSSNDGGNSGNVPTIGDPDANFDFNVANPELTINGVTATIHHSQYNQAGYSAYGADIWGNHNDSYCMSLKSEKKIIQIEFNGYNDSYGAGTLEVANNLGDFDFQPDGTSVWKGNENTVKFWATSNDVDFYVHSVKVWLSDEEPSTDIVPTSPVDPIYQTVQVQNAEVGKVYTLTMYNYSRQEYPITIDGGRITPKMGATHTMFECGNHGDGLFFITADDKYLRNVHAVGNWVTTSGDKGNDGSDSGLSSTYKASLDVLEFEPIPYSSTYVTSANAYYNNCVAIHQARFTGHPGYTTFANNGSNSGSDAIMYKSDATSAFILREVQGFPTSTLGQDGEYYYGTYFANHAWVIPEGYEAYVVTAASNEEMTLEQVTGNVVGANTAVILKGAQNANLDIAFSLEEGYTNSNNMLRGSVEDFDNIHEDGYKYYVLNYKNGANLGFYWQKGSGDGSTVNCAAHKAYLRVPVSSGNSNGFAFRFEDTITDIQSVNAEAENNAPVYNLQGQRVNATKAGVYVKNGKKFIVK